MSILTVTHVAKSFGTETLFDDINFTVVAGQKMGLVGRNGSGKTTLLRILLGQETPDASVVGGQTLPARVSLASGRRLGYLRQEAPVHPERTILEEVQSVFVEARALEAQLQDAEHAMGEAENDAALERAMDAYAALREQFEQAGGYNYAADLDLVLTRLGFRESDYEKRVGSCSGGEQTRLALAKLVLTRPDLLILDEPTNHLDIDATEWLEGFLKNYDGAVLLVSHDRYFLDAVADTIADLDHQKLTIYRGNYSHFRQQKDEQIVRQTALHEQQQAEIERLQAVIKRNMGADSVQSALRHRMQGRIERMDKVEKPREDTSTVKAMFDAESAGRVGRTVLECDGLAKRYGERTLFQNLNCQIERGDRVGLVGANGAGKTTLVKLILGQEQPTNGLLTLGHNVRLSYFSQHAADQLDPTRTVIESLTDLTDFTETEARNYLARFLFTGDDVFKIVAMLSGGEKNKLALARMIVAPCNLLILDEPTNHLDIASCEALTQMLARYEGTLLLISHDRYLLNATTTQTLALSGNGTTTYFEGNYAAWREASRQPVSMPPPTKKAAAPVKKPEAAAPRANGSGTPPAYSLNARDLSKARVKARESVASSEHAVHALEDRIEDVETRLARPSGSVGDMVALAAEHTRLQDDLLAALSAWEQAVAHQEVLDA